MPTVVNGVSNFTLAMGDTPTLAEVVVENVPLDRPIIGGATLFITSVDADATTIDVAVESIWAPPLPAFSVPRSTVATDLAGVVPIPGILFPAGLGRADLSLQLGATGASGPCTGIYVTTWLAWEDEGLIASP